MEDSGSDRILIPITISAEVENEFASISKSFQKVTEDITKMSSGIGQSFRNIVKQMSSSFETSNAGIIGNLHKGFNELQSSLKQTSKETEITVRGIERSLSSLSSMKITKTKLDIDISELTKAKNILDNLNKAAKKASEKTGTDITVNKLQKKNALEAGGIEEKYQKDVYKSLEKAEAARAVLAKKTEEMQIRTYANLGRLAERSIIDISTSATKQAGFITSLANKSIEALQNIKSVSGNLAKDVANALSGKKVLDQTLVQEKELGKALQILEKQKTEAIRAEQLARLAYEKQTNAEAKAINEQQWRNTLTHLNNIIAKYNEAASAHGKLGQTRADREKRYESSISAIRENALKQIAPVNLESVFNRLNTNFQKVLSSASAFGEGGKQAIERISEGIKKDISELKVFENNLIAVKNELSALSKSRPKDTALKQDLQGVKDLITELGKYKKEYLDAARMSQKMVLSGPVFKSEQNFDVMYKKANDLRKVISGLTSEVSQKLKTGGGSAFSILEAGDAWKSASGAATKYETIVKGVEKDISKLMLESQRIEVEKVKETNKIKLQALENYSIAVKNQIAFLQKEMLTLQKAIPNISKTIGMDVLNAGDKFLKSIQMQGTDKGTGLWNSLRESLAGMKKEYDNITYQSTRFKQANVESARASKEAFDKLKGTFDENREKVKRMVTELKALTKKGIIDATTEIANLERLQSEYTNLSNKVRNYAAAIGKMSTAQERMAAKSPLTRFWEYFRDLRWQIAAVYYMATRAVQAVKRLFLDSLREVSEFRASIFGLAASIGLSMGKSFGIGFEYFYNYSADLMDKLQNKAATTYATMEDLMMVTKTFAQAGVFIRDDKDVERISTIASAVKLLTEGMSNAGTQMRQEIYALLRGTQRATDQVAMAFKLMGVDIKKQMVIWKSEGKSIIEGIADSLDAVRIMNEKISNEYLAQVNRLKSMWAYIKRIALEDMTLSMAQDLKKFTSLLGDPGKGLTEYGKGIATKIRAAFEVVWEFSKQVGAVIVGILEIIGELGRALVATFDLFLAIVNSIATGFGLWGDPIKETKDNFSGIAQSVEGLLKAIIIVGGFLQTWAATVRGIVHEFTAIVYTIRAIGKALKASVQSQNPFSDADKVKKLFEEADEFLGKAKKEFVAPFFELTDIFKGMEESWGNSEKIAERIHNLFAKGFNLDQDFQNLINYGATVGKGLIDVQSRLNEMRKESLTKEESGQEKVEALRDAVEKQVELSNAGLQKLEAKVLEIDARIASEVEATHNLVNNNVLDSTKNSLTQILALENTAENALLRLADVSQKQTFGNVFAPKYGPRKSTLQDDLIKKKMLEGSIETIGKLQDELANSEGIFDAYLAKLAKKSGKTTEKTAEELYDQYMDLYDKLGSLTPFDKVENQYKNHLREIAKLAAENDYIAQNRTEFELAAEAWKNREMLEATREYKDTYESLKGEILGTELSQIEKLVKEYEELDRKVEKAFYWDENAKLYLQGIISTGFEIKRLRMETEKYYEISGKQLDNYSRQADILEKSVNPYDKQVAAIIKLVGAHERLRLGIEKEIIEKERAYGTDKAGFEQYKSILEEQLRLDKEFTEAEIKDVQEPFWKRMKEMAEGFVEGFSTALNDALWDFKNFSKNLQDFFTNTLKQFTQAFIQYNFVEPLMKQLASAGDQKGGFQGVAEGKYNPLTWISKLSGMLGGFGGEKSSSDNIFSSITTINPLPVKVVNDIVTDIGKGIEGNTLGTIGTGVTDLFSGSKDLFSFKTTQEILQTPSFGFGTGVPGITENTSTETNESLESLNQPLVDVAENFEKLENSSSSLSGSFMSSARSLISGISSLFGAEGAQAVNLAGQALQFGTMAAKSYGYAEGGIINEPVFGVGLKSGSNYTLGEKGDEVVTPMSKMDQFVDNAETTNIHMSLSINAVDTQTGMEFLMKHSDFLQSQMVKAIRNNKSIRSSVKRS